MTSKPLYLITNGGELRANRIGMFYNSQVWYNSKSITNILSFSSIADKYRIVIDTVKEKNILVEIEDDKWMKFTKNNLALHIYNMRKGFSTYNNNDTKNTLTPYSLLQTISHNAELFTHKEKQLVQEAKNLSKRFGCPPL